MADPLSVAASVVSLAIPALHGIRLLRDIQNIIDAPKAVVGLKEDLLSVDMAIEALKALKSSEWESLGQDVAKESKYTISICTSACDMFRNDLQRWIKHSEDGKLSWRDRANVGFFQQQRIKSLSKQLQNCKITISVVVNIATLHSSIRHTHITEEIKKTIITGEKEITTAIARRDAQIVDVGNRLQEVSSSDTAQDIDEVADDKAGVLKQIEEDEQH